MSNFFLARLPTALVTTGVLISLTLVTAPAFRDFPHFKPFSWAAVPLVLALAAYLAASAGTAIFTSLCISFSIPRGSALRSRQRSQSISDGQYSSDIHGAVALGLAALVLLSAATHLGEKSGSWYTSVPLHERSVAPAEGYAYWLDSVPVQSDSVNFVIALNSITGVASQNEIDAWVRSGRIGYAFLISLLAPFTYSLLGSVYSAFVLVNVFFWWGGVMAMYDLAWRAFRSWWIGLGAAILTASGIGFTYMVGNAMSSAASFGAVAMLFWLMHRLGVFERERSHGWAEDVVTASLAASVGLLNSLAPFLLGFVFFYFAGRADLRRLFIWGSTVLLLGGVWSRLLQWITAGDQASNAFPWSAFTGYLIAAGLLAGFSRLSRRWGEWMVGTGVTLAVVVAVAVLLIMPGVIIGRLDAAYAAVHVPDYLRERGPFLGFVGQGSQSSLPAVLDSLRATYLDSNILAAFPGPVLLLALVGLFRLPRQWLEWAVAVTVSASLVALAMIVLTSEPHARLVYYAFPAVYLVAANGLRNCHDAVLALASASRRVLPVIPAGTGRVLAGACVVGLLIAAAIPSYASLWGDTLYDYRFHFVIL